ncbi:MAG: hypothetical protein JW929_16425 [Anaerolineales bacterium]|nr:hypothetical protein [Anaerolineales bacterium]
MTLLIGLATTGCGGVQPPSQMNQATAHILTLYAVLTDSAPVQNTTPTNPIVLPTATPGIPTETLTPAPTNTAELPSVTPTSSQLPTPCYRAYFVKDMTVPDETKMDPGETFVKTWRLRNSGTCNWSAGIQVVFLSGNKMGAPESQEIGEAVAVGAEVDISLTMKAPNDAGKYEGYWMLKVPNGGRFGTGDNGDQSFWVIIVVAKSGTPSATKTVGTPPPTKTPTRTATPTFTPTGSPTLTPTPTATCPGGYPVC